jgi:hypothetical protein
MRAHHTKDKGDLGVLYAKVDLAEKGYLLLQPLSEHSPFDLVAYKDGRFLRIQVNYRAAVKGAVFLRLKSSWADYFDPKTVEVAVCLRIDAPLNNQRKHIRWAKDFTEIPLHLSGLQTGT